MQSLLFIICVHLIFISHSIPIHAMPPLHPFTGGASQSFHQQAQFGEGIRDWFVDMKDRIFGNSHPPELSRIFIHAKEDYEHQKKMFEDFWLDLMHIVAHLSFDPDRDWGFHLGPWFIIKKRDHSNTNKANLPDTDIKIVNPPITEGWIYHEDKSLAVPTIPTTIVTLFDRETTTYTIEENSTFEIDVNEIENEKNNETYHHFTSD